jgi:signal transduction histidine kinase
MRLKLVLSFILVVIVTLVTFALIARQNTLREVQSYMFRGGMAGVEEIVAELESYYRLYGSWAGVEPLLSTPMHGGPMMGGRGKGGMMRQRLILADADGMVLVDTNGSVRGMLSADDRSRAVVLKMDGRTIGYLLPEGGVSFIQGDEFQLINRLTRNLLPAFLIAAGLALLLALVLAYGLLRPIRALTHAATGLARGDMSQRVAVQGRDELATLGQTFNQMAEALQQAEETRRAMTADIAHELRNPLAVQLANLEALQDGIYPLTSESLAPILEQNQLLNRLVDDLRTLALADAGQLTLERIPTNFPALVERIVERFRPSVAARQVDLRLDLPASPAPPVICDPIRIEQIISNLLSNALYHTPEGGKIECRLSESSNAAGALPVVQQTIILTVRDTGAGLPAEALPRIFERFYRADKARTRSEGGAGLGLAIARQLAEAHGGSLAAANYPAGGAIFTLTLPFKQRDAKLKSKPPF